MRVRWSRQAQRCGALLRRSSDKSTLNASDHRAGVHPESAQRPPPPPPPPPPPRFTIAASEISALPPFKYPGQITLVYRPSQLEAALQRLEGEELLGFDTESQPMSQELALLQFASERHAVLVRRSALREPVARQRLGALLESNRVIKVGQQPFSELRALEEQLGIRARNVADVAHAARVVDTAPLNLRALTAIFLRQQLDKKMQRSNWAAYTLSGPQIEYAAADAFAARQVFLRVMHVFGTERGTGSLHESVKRSGALLGDFADDTQSIRCGRCNVPISLGAFDPLMDYSPRYLLAEWLRERGLGEPLYSLALERPEGFLMRVSVPALDRSFTHSAPFRTTRAAAQFVALKALHELHEDGFSARIRRHATEILSQIARKRRHGFTLTSAVHFERLAPASDGREQALWVAYLNLPEELALNGRATFSSRAMPTKREAELDVAQTVLDLAPREWLSAASLD